jgi:hypothetical protein
MIQGKSAGRPRAQKVTKPPPKQSLQPAQRKLPHSGLLEQSNARELRVARFLMVSHLAATA